LTAISAAWLLFLLTINPFECKGIYSAIANNMTLAHWLLMDVLFIWYSEEGTGQPAQTPPRCTNYNSPPINGQCTNHRIAGGLYWSVALRF